MLVERWVNVLGYLCLLIGAHEISAPAFSSRRNGTLSLFLFLINFICLFLSVLSLCYCTRLSLVVEKRGLLFTTVHGLLIAVASLAVEHWLQ